MADGMTKGMEEKREVVGKSPWKGMLECLATLLDSEQVRLKLERMPQNTHGTAPDGVVLWSWPRGSNPEKPDADYAVGIRVNGIFVEEGSERGASISNFRRYERAIDAGRVLPGDWKESVAMGLTPEEIFYLQKPGRSELEGVTLHDYLGKFNLKPPADSEVNNPLQRLRERMPRLT